MKQEMFQARHETEWQDFELWLESGGRPKARDRRRGGEGASDDTGFPLAFRRLCQQLALAQRRGYSALLVARLQELVERGHLVLYRPRAPRLVRVLEFFSAGFPRLVRAHWRAMSAAALLFFLPLIAAVALLQVHPELVHTLFDPGQLASFENMYDPASTDRIGRESGGDRNSTTGGHQWNSRRHRHA